MASAHLSIQYAGLLNSILCVWCSVCQLLFWLPSIEHDRMTGSGLWIVDNDELLTLANALHEPGCA